MKYIITFLFLISFSARARECKITNTDRDRIRYETHDLRIVNTNNIVGNGCISVCTGFIEHDGLIVTAAHCLRNRRIGGKILVIFADGQMRDFTVVLDGNILNLEPEMIPVMQDYAVLKGDTSGYPTLPFPNITPSLPLRTFSIGYGPNGPQAVLPIVADHYYHSPTAYELELVGEVDHGDSGGPVLGVNDTAIGIVVRADFSGSSADACPYQVVLEALKKEKLQ